MAVEQLSEQAYSSRASIKVDRDAGVIRGVKFIGLSSGNGRDYPAEVLEKARALYEGKPINVDHNRTTPERKIADRFGKAQNVAITSDGLYGDVKCLKSHPLFETVMEIAADMPELIGLSHTAEGRTRVEKGRTIVEEIVRVKSVDLVTDPATTKGLFESAETQIKLAQLIERLQQDAPADPYVVALVEIAQTSPIYAGIGLEPTPEAKTEQQVQEAFLAMVVATFKDPNTGAKEKLQKIKLILDSQEKLMGTAANPTPPATPAAPAAPAAPVAESLVESLATPPVATPASDELTKLRESHDKLVAKLALTEAREEASKLLRDAKIEANEELIEAIAARPDTAARKKLIEALPKAGAPNPTPRSQARTVPIDESKKAPVDMSKPESVAKFLRGR